MAQIPKPRPQKGETPNYISSDEADLLSLEFGNHVHGRRVITINRLRSSFLRDFRTLMSQRNRRQVTIISDLSQTDSSQTHYYVYRFAIIVSSLNAKNRPSAGSNIFSI